MLHSTTQIADLRTAEAQESDAAAAPTTASRAPRCPLFLRAPRRRCWRTTQTCAGCSTQSDNGTAAGPSGWGGNMIVRFLYSRTSVAWVSLRCCAMSSTASCRTTLASCCSTSRLVALAKPNSDGLRPIAVGELFYRLAAIVAVRRVSGEAATLLSPTPVWCGRGSGGGEDCPLAAARADGQRQAARATADLSLYSDGVINVISIANVGSKLAICLQHLSGGSACILLLAVHCVRQVDR